jgi:Domain of Unknown Function (DUF1080).
MKQISLIFALAVCCLVPALSQKSQTQSFSGRWDLTIKTQKDTYPSWMEVTEQAGKPEVRIVGRVASVHPATDVKLSGGKLSFSTTEHFGKRIKVDWEVTAQGGKLTGTQKREDGVTGQLTGLPAPALDRKVSDWQKPQPLFNGKDLTGWEPLITEPGKPVKSNWKAEGGELVNAAPGANIRTKRKFQDFKLHVEYNCPKDGNSGVYLRGRYEVQVEYESVNLNDKLHGMGSIYGFLAPAEVAPRPGQWETLDITWWAGMSPSCAMASPPSTIVRSPALPEEHWIARKASRVPCIFRAITRAV